MTRTFVRAGAFARSELVSTLRQPQLLLVLILGPFLVLFVFGLGYEHTLPSLSTVVVGSEGELTDRVDEFVRQEEPAGMDYQGTTRDADAALADLRAGEVDLVVVLPDRPLEELGRNERAVIEVHQRSLDPVTSTQIAVAADSAVSEINDAVLQELVGDLQAQTAGVEEQLSVAREQFERLRSAIDADDVALLQEAARELADQFALLGGALEATGGLGLPGAITGELDEVVSRLQGTAEQLERFAEADAMARIEEAGATLGDVEQLVSELRDVEPEIVVRPFEADVISATPQPVTLERFFAPGLVALMLQHLGVTFAALAIVRERQNRTTELLQVAPVGTGERLAGKTVAFLLLGALAAAILTTLIVLVFEVPLPPDWLAFVALVALTLLASLGIGFLVAAGSSTDGQAVQYAMLLLLTAIFFSGLFMPLERIAMPVEVVSWLMPTTYAFVGLQELMLLGRPVPPLLYAGLGLIALVTFALARLLLPRRHAIA